MSKDVLSRTVRRLLNLIGRARVNLVDDSGPVQMVQVTVNELETIDRVPRVQEFGFASVPPKGSDVALIFIGGDRGNGAIVGSNHQASRQRGLKYGESMIYTEDGKRIYLTASGGIEIDANGQPVTINNSTTVTINASTGVVMNTPLLQVSGDILDNYGTNTRTVAGMRQVANMHTHKVVNVQGGGSTIETNPPDQPE
ncbi:hypothetical protein LMG28688_01623 [Paraburkholderia caffeinitolerans]|uniref:Bacteriophage Mu Gp45 N-terminal domain-containing protein n=1 Tax=Paraburkholderia caffeinitolerans TaxID=1723730 RepID=A0A6J5FQK1_9BURK|nr:phage baseplate assembly protein V [Paraburkholderia caffeinitolerans]CAB3783319.1 hypothetical protein LMG28688_01623 [Paraburkholderia caffeinitolerans]